MVQKVNAWNLDNYNSGSNVNNMPIPPSTMTVLSASAAYLMTGMKAAADGTTVEFVNASAYTQTLKYNSGSSSSGNQYLFSGGTDVPIEPYSIAIVKYSAALGYWLLVGSVTQSSWMGYSSGGFSAATTSVGVTTPGSGSVTLYALIAGVMTSTGQTGTAYNLSPSSLAAGWYPLVIEPFSSTFFTGQSMSLNGNTYQTAYFTSTTTLGGTGPGTSGQFLVSNGASSAPTFQTISVGTGTVTSITATNGLTGGTITTTGSIGLPSMTDGQLIIGCSSGDPAAANLTSSAGTITITNGCNTINLDLTTTPGTPGVSSMKQYTGTYTNGVSSPVTSITKSTGLLGVMSGNTPTISAGSLTWSAIMTAANGNTATVSGSIGTNDVLMFAFDNTSGTPNCVPPYTSMALSVEGNGGNGTYSIWIQS